MKWSHVLVLLLVPAFLAILLWVGMSVRPVSGADEFTVVAQGAPQRSESTSLVRSAIHYQGVAMLGGAPINGKRAVTFSLSNNATCQSSSDPVTIELDFVDGVFSAVVPVPIDAFDGDALWLKATSLDNQNPPVEALFSCDEILPVPYALWSNVSVASGIAASLSPYTSYLSIPMKGNYWVNEFYERKTEPVMLPHGATITRITSTGECYQAEFVRINLASGAEQVLAAHATASGVISTTTAPPPNPLVDNMHYAYAIVANTDFVAPACNNFVVSGGGNWPLLPLHGVTIEYVAKIP